MRPRRRRVFNYCFSDRDIGEALFRAEIATNDHIIRRVDEVVAVDQSVFHANGEYHVIVYMQCDEEFCGHPQTTNGRGGVMNRRCEVCGEVDFYSIHPELVH